MLVAIYLGGFHPEIGGGYTFQIDVLRHLLQDSQSSPHRFTLLCASKAIESFALKLDGIDKVRVVSVRKPGPVQKGVGLLTRSSAILRRLYLAPGPIERAALDCGAEIVWFIGGGAPEVMDLPYIGTIWDLQHRLQPWFPEISAKGQWEIRESVLPRFLQRAAYVIVGTHAGYNEAQLFYGLPGSRIRILPHPTPSLSEAPIPPDLAESTLRKYSLSPGYLLYPAQFWPHKNHVNLILGLAALRKRHGISLNLVLAGSDKGNRAYVESVVKSNGLGEQVHFLGFVPVEDLVVLYRNALALAYLTLTGPENLPPLEAFSLGCPVLASAVSGAEEQLGNAALLVDPLDVNAIADGLKALHDDSELRARLIARGAERARGWTGREFVRGVHRILDEFALVRRNWTSLPA